MSVDFDDSEANLADQTLVRMFGPKARLQLLRKGARYVYVVTTRQGSVVATVATNPNAIIDTDRSVLALTRSGGLWPCLPILGFKNYGRSMVTMHPLRLPIQPGTFDGFKYGKTLFRFHRRGEDWMRQRLPGEFWNAPMAEPTHFFVEGLLRTLTDSHGESSSVVDAYSKCLAGMDFSEPLPTGNRATKALTVVLNDTNLGNVLEDPRDHHYWFTDLGESGVGLRDKDFVTLAYLVMMKGLDETHFEATRRGYGSYAPNLADLTEFVIDGVIHRLGLALQKRTTSDVHRAAVDVTRRMADRRFVPSAEEWKLIADVVEPEYYWDGAKLASPRVLADIPRMSRAMPESITWRL